MQCCSMVSLMHHARAMKTRGKLCVVGDIVAVRKEHEAHASHLFDTLCQGSCESRGIDQYVSASILGPHDQVRPCAKACFRGEAAEIHVVHDVHRECFNARASAAVRHGANRSGRTGDQRHEGAMLLPGIPRLAVDDGLIAVFAKTRRRNLAAGVAVDAAVIHVEFAFDVFGPRRLLICAIVRWPNTGHEPLDSAWGMRKVASFPHYTARLSDAQNTENTL